ncbi:MAG: MATE family efflux transporter [Puniceicoccales bacterium]|jgi:MATE family multidrug resistance protein|nr:MATE family efflux transporter [Puniceicoccales bacterium]
MDPKNFIVSLWPELRKTIFLVFPIALGQGGHGLLFVVDAVMAGHLGVSSLAAAAFVGNTVVLVSLFGFGLAIPVSVLTSQGRGAGHPGHGAAALRHGFLLVGAFGMLSAVFVHGAVLSGVLTIFGQDPVVEREAVEFTIWLVWSNLPAFLFQCLKNHREAVGEPWQPLLWLCIGVAATIVFNWIFMFGHLGAPEMGLAGAGVGTFLGRVVMFVGLACHPGRPEIRWRDGFHLGWLKDVLVLGVPSAFQWALEAGVFTVVAVLMGLFGKEQQAAHQVAISLASLAFMVPVGISQGTSIRMAECYGARNLPKMRQIAAGALLFSLLFMGVYVLLVVVFNEAIPRLYLSGDLSSPETAAFAAQFILVAAAFALCDGLQVVAVGALRGMSDVKFILVAAFGCYWGVSLPVGVLLAWWLGWGGLGLWIGLACGICAAAVVLNFRLWWKLGKGCCYA